MGEKEFEPVHVQCLYNVSPEIIFDAWVKPEFIRKWLFVGPSSQIVNVKINLVVGGEFSILELEKSNGGYIDHFGKYQEINRPKRLVFTLSVPKHFPGETVVTVEIESRTNGCELKLTQTGVSRDITEKNWSEMLQQLKTVIEGMHQ
jgi:uncharacterized protein YndB with AHSA1/START domain